VLLTTAIINPTGIAVDASGNLFVIDASTALCTKIVGGTGTPVNHWPVIQLTGGRYG